MDTLNILNATLPDGNRTSLHCRDGVIHSMGDDLPAADRTLDAEGLIAHPPLINSHTHASMTLFRGNGDDLPLMEWLTKRVWPYEQQIEAEEIYWGARLAILEMIRAGTVYFNDMYWDFHAVARAVEEMGVRATVSAVLIDVNGDGKHLRKQIELNERLYEEAKEYGERVRFAVAPHAIYTVSEEGLRWTAEFSREKDVMLHTHLAETRQEVEDCYREHGCSPVAYMHRCGMLSPRLVAAHTVWLNEEDIALLGEHQVVCAHNPVSNMKLSVEGHYPYRKLQQAGAIPAIATDGAGSNNNLDLFEEMKIASLLQKYREHDPTALPAEDVLDMAVRNGAEVFGVSGPEITVGRQADLIFIDGRMPEMAPLHSLASHLVYAVNGACVRHVVCGGRVLMEDRFIPGQDEIVAKASEAAMRLFKRVDQA